jgi:hypothetical protein
MIVLYREKMKQNAAQFRQSTCGLPGKTSNFSRE